MPSMEDILSSLLGEEGQTKTAAASAPVSDEDAVIAKVAAQLSSEEVDQLEKIAEDAETEKTAAEAMAYGRLMARGFHDELSKLAADGEVGLTGSMNSETSNIGSRTIANGGGNPVAQQALARTPQDGSTVLSKIKSSVEALHTPASPTAKEDAVKMVRKIIDAARPVRQQVAEVPHNG